MTTARWQAVWITLSDGTIAKFVGPAVVEEGDTRTITKIQFTAPAEMPAGVLVTLPSLIETQPIIE